MAFAISPILVKNQTKENVNNLLLIYAIASTVFCGPMCFMFMEKPKSFPSKSAQELKSKDFNFKKNLSQLLSNGNYLILTFCFSLVFGVHAGLSALLSEFLSPFGFDSV